MVYVKYKAGNNSPTKECLIPSNGSGTVHSYQYGISRSTPLFSAHET